MVNSWPFSIVRSTICISNSPHPFSFMRNGGSFLSGRGQNGGPAGTARSKYTLNHAVLKCFVQAILSIAKDAGCDLLFARTLEKYLDVPVA